MIIDTLENFSLYLALNPKFAEVNRFMSLDKLKALAEGKTVIDGQDLFVNNTVAKGKTAEQARIETHNRMLDIQIPLSGEETFGYSSRDSLPEADYDDVKDITFYTGPSDTYVTVKPGQFVIFFPQDGHAPCISQEESIHKVIFKVKHTRS